MGLECLCRENLFLSHPEGTLGAEDDPISHREIDDRPGDRNEFPVPELIHRLPLREGVVDLRLHTLSDVAVVSREDQTIARVHELKIVLRFTSRLLPGLEGARIYYLVSREPLLNQRDLSLLGGAPVELHGVGVEDPHESETSPKLI